MEAELLQEMRISKVKKISSFFIPPLHVEGCIFQVGRSSPTARAADREKKRASAGCGWSGESKGLLYYQLVDI